MSVFLIGPFLGFLIALVIATACLYIGFIWAKDLEDKSSQKKEKQLALVYLRLMPPTLKAKEVENSDQILL